MGHLPSEGLQRRLGFIPAVAAGLGVTIGAGIYVLIGAAAGSAGSAVWLSFVMAAVIASFTALSYARLVKLRPKNAPEFHFVSMAFNTFSGFLAGWLTLWAMIVSAAVVSLGFAGYLQYVSGVPLVAGALGLILVATLFTFLGIKQSVGLLVALTVPTILGLVAVIVIGIPSIGDRNLFEAPLGFAGISSAAALVFFAYLGFETMANLAEEMKQPQKDLPRAMLAVLAVSTLFYVLVALAAVSVLGWAELSTSVSPMSAVAAKTTGSGVGILVSWLSLAATGSTGLFLIVAASRAVWAMSCAGVLPLPFCTIGRRRTPWIAIVGVGVLAAIFVLTRNVETVAQVTNIAVLLAFAGVNASAIKLLGKSGLGIYQGLRSRLLPVLGLVSSLWLAFNTGTTAIISAALLIVIGMVYYRLFLMKKAVFLDVPGQENNKPE